ncbi:NADH-quinone oxidoreductase subunit C [Streptomyces sp. NPDC059851]|uniref:NADH-quinone oxidoreductase subunit C n=1 Tax=Streptomyces sp. NPDC059851 TaxID=3346971 RepID=UPI0036595A24
MNPYDSLPDAAATVFGAEAVAELAYDVLTVDVPVGSWIPALETARDKLGCTYFDWLSAVDEPGTGFRVCAHVVSLEDRRVRRLLLRTTVPHSAPSLPSAVAVYAGAAWHERETFEMFGVVFTDHPHLVPLLLPENFEGHPLRKDFVLAARVAKAWPGAKEPGEGAEAEGGPKRRQMLPPGVPDPNDWGPLKGQLPPAPARPARTPRAAGAGAAARTPREGAPVRRTRSVAQGSASQTTGTAAADAAAEAPAARPVRRTRSAADGSASQAAPAAGAAAGGAGAEAEAPIRPARRTRSAADGSASQAAEAAVPEAGAEAPARPPRRSRSAADGSVSQAAEPPAPESDTETPVRPARRTRSAADGSASQATGATGAAGGERKPPARRSSDAPWHDPKPAFDEDEPPARRDRKAAAPGEDTTPDHDPTDTTSDNADNGGDA